MPNVTVMFANTKGGVGKSTLAYLTAIYLAATERLRVLAIDFDPQSTLYGALTRFEDEMLNVRDWSDAAGAGGMERGRLLNHIQSGKANSDVLLIDTPAGFAAGDLGQFISPDLLVVPVTASDADIFATKTYLNELTEGLTAQGSGPPPKILIIPNQVYDADCVSRIRDSFRSLHATVGRPLPHAREFRDIFRFVHGDANITRVVRDHSAFLRWLSAHITDLYYERKGGAPRRGLWFRR